MFNEDSCRRCGLILTAMCRCNDCLETSSWICKNCNNSIDRIHFHGFETANPDSNKVHLGIYGS